MSSLMTLSSASSMLPRTPLYRWLAVAFFVLVIVWYHPNFSGSSIADSSSTTSFSGNGVDDLTYVRKLLKENKIGPEIEYAARTIRYVPDARQRKSITEVNQNLFPQSFKNITISKNQNLPSSRLLDLHVKQSPRPDQVDASDLIFGVSTTYDRFTNEGTSPMKEWVRWLTDGNGHTNGAGLILALFNTTEENLGKAAKTLESVGINATVVPSNLELDMPGRYVDLVHMLYNHPTRSSRKYFVLIDDDTFFPYMNEFRNTLRQYDPAKPYYIGTFTERVDWILQNGAPFAYGGGGIVLTEPAAQKIVGLPCLEKKEDGSYVLASDQGDRLLFNCLREHTDITLTYLPSLHQEDQFGDPSGFYESGIQPLSLHHYKSWHHFNPDRMHVVADACGESCVLQRFQFLDNYIITNGFSVVHYPQGIDFDPLQTEGTFGSGNDGDSLLHETVFSYSFGQLRKNMNHTGKKKGWELLGAKKEGDGRVKQVYVKRRGEGRWLAEGEDAPLRDSIVVLTWIP